MFPVLLKCVFRRVQTNEKAKLILFLCFMAVLTACGNTNSSTEPAKKKKPIKRAQKNQHKKRINQHQDF